MKAIAVVLVLGFIWGVSIFAGVHASATQGALWPSGVPTIARNTSILGGSYDGCATFRQEVFVSELGAPRSICVYGDEHLKIGTFFENGTDRTSVQFPYSNTMHILEGACASLCRYSADTDTLLMQQYLGQSVRGLVVYRHVSDRVKREVVSAATVKYVFDTLHPDYVMKNDDGRPLSVSAIDMSENGKRAVVELNDHGTASINLETMTTRHITTDGPLYGRGMDPTEELAISDDGKSVVVTGQNAGLRVMDITESCGQALIGDLGPLRDTVVCPSSDLGIGNLFPGFIAGHMPRFFNDGHQLELIITSAGAGVRRVSFLVQDGLLAHQLKLLSLGDSFTSGEGETDDVYYEPGTNQQFDKCHVSSRAYASLVARRLGISSTDQKNIACSGAKIGDIVGSGDYWGQGNRLGDSGLKLSVTDTVAAQEHALDNFQPGRTLQANFLDRYNPEMVLIGIGGNDAGLMGKLRTCAMPGTCEWALGDGIKETAGEIRRLFDSLGTFFSQISNKVDHSHVFIVGYPDIIEPDGRCDPVTSFLMDRTERVFVQNSLQYLNRVINVAANKAGFNYVDLEHSFDGTKLCSVPTAISMNGLRLGDDIPVFDELPMLKIIGAETFHPTPAGHAHMADAILDQYPALVAEPSNEENLDVEPSSYWTLDGAPPERVAFATDFASVNQANKHQLTIAVPENALEPHSIVTVELRSDPVKLATFVVGENGGLKASITVPMSKEKGFHTLHLLATNMAGSPVDLYQFVTVGESGAVIAVGSEENNETVLNDNERVERKASLSDIGDVLGVQTTNGVKSSLEKVIRPTVSSIQQTLGSFWWICLGLLIVILSVLSTITTILLSRRWAKPSS